MDTRSGTLKIGRIRGIDVKLHWSWAIIVFLFTTQLAAGYFPTNIPGRSSTLYFILGLISTLLLFISVLLHEFSHSFVALSRGLRVKDITLYMLGGVSAIEDEPQRPFDEFIIAFAGPLMSILLGGTFFLMGLVSPLILPFGPIVPSVLQYLGQINLILAAFNLIPAFPLDGGRVLRSIIWGIRRDMSSATKITGLIGQFSAGALAIIGLSLFFLLGDSSGLWTCFIAWYLFQSARNSTKGASLRPLLQGIQVAEVMEPPPPFASPNMTLYELYVRFIMPFHMHAIPIVEEEHLAGIITLGDMRRVPQEEWARVAASQIMTRGDKLLVTHPYDNLNQALQLLTRKEIDQLPVVDPRGKVVGILTRARLLYWLNARESAKNGASVGQPLDTVPQNNDPASQSGVNRY